MTDSIVDAMAQALIDRIGSPWPYDEMDPMIKELWHGHARAALSVALDHMREPSNEMCGAGQDELDYGNPVVSAYRAMLDQLRKEVFDE